MSETRNPEWVGDDECGPAIIRCYVPKGPLLDQLPPAPSRPSRHKPDVVFTIGGTAEADEVLPAFRSRTPGAAAAHGSLPVDAGTIGGEQGSRGRGGSRRVHGREREAARLRGSPAHVASFRHL